MIESMKLRLSKLLVEMIAVVVLLKPGMSVASTIAEGLIVDMVVVVDDVTAAAEAATAAISVVYRLVYVLVVVLGAPVVAVGVTTS